MILANYIYISLHFLGDARPGFGLVRKAQTG